MAKKADIDALSGVETTGHEWDGLKELNNPLPKWWLYVFYACIAWSLVYYVLYPAWPLGSTYTKGLLGYSQREELVKSMAEAKAAQFKYLDGIAKASVDVIQKNKELATFAQAGGRTIFNENCSACHGPGGQGAKGYPGLADDIWLWGGSVADIYQTIKGGVRQGDVAATRGTPGSGMPAFADQLKADQVEQLAEYVLALTNRATDKAKADKGMALFADNCAACHGDKGQGSIAAGLPDIGAPPLNTANWIYGGDKATLVQTITQGRAGEMPAWSKRLDDVTIKQLAIYVHNLGGGK